MLDMLDRIIRENGLDNSRLSYEDKEKLAKSALGLTAQEAENAFSRAIVANRGLDGNAIRVIFDEKKSGD